MAVDHLVPAAQSTFNVNATFHTYSFPFCITLCSALDRTGSHTFHHVFVQEEIDHQCGQNR